MICWNLQEIMHRGRRPSQIGISFSVGLGSQTRFSCNGYCSI